MKHATALHLSPDDFVGFVAEISAFDLDSRDDHGLRRPLQAVRFRYDLAGELSPEHMGMFRMPRFHFRESRPIIAPIPKSKFPASMWTSPMSQALASARETASGGTDTQT